MKLSWRYLLFLLWLSYLLVTSILLFARGFLLNRTILNTKSTCGSRDHICLDVWSSSEDEEVLAGYSWGDAQRCLDSVSDGSQYCTESNTSVIILLIDALRYDFVATEIDDLSLPYKNKLTVIDEMLKSNSGRLYKFVADPPTTTLQRLNGLMTGSLPTFIDAGSNFATSEITEDNLIDQLVKNNRSVVQMGDDTWTQLFPGRFLRSYPFPSFNVWDLDTVDKGIKIHLTPEILKKDWDVLIAHFLGVDHCGHRYGPNHPEMERKLLEMNEVIGNVISVMDANSVLFVFGDHGMTKSGDHGGDSDNEVSSALFVYSPNKTILSNFRDVGSIRQIDLTPTLSALLGIPIPFSNLGSSIININADSEKFISSSLWMNVLQATSYIKAYSDQNTQLPPDSLNKLLEKFHFLTLLIRNIKNNNDVQAVSVKAQEYLKMLREICENVWVRFDSISMSRGLVLLFLNIALALIFVDGMPSKCFQDIIKSNFMWYGFMSIILSVLVTYLLFIFDFISNFELSLYFITNTASLVVFSITISLNWVEIANHWHLQGKTSAWSNIIFRVIVLFSSFGLFSNSYVVEESSVVSYMYLTSLWISVLMMRSQITKKINKFGSLWTYNQYSVRRIVIVLAIILSILIRISWFYWQCREEQSSKCIFDKNKFDYSLSLLSTVVFAVFITISRNILKNFGNLVGFSPPVFISRYLPTVCVVCSGCYWILHSLPARMKPKLIPWQLLLLPRFVLCTSVLCIIVYFIKPLCIYYITKEEQRNRVFSDSVSLFHYLKAILIKKSNNDVPECPIVYGLATAYSATFLNIAVFLCLISAILLGESRALVSIILILSLILLTIILATVRHSRSNSQGDNFLVPWWSVVCWGFSSLYFFYGTGHQPTFPGIQWDAAFLMGDIVSTFLPGVLVIVNTFISQILHALLLPLLFISQFTLGVVWPLATQNIDLKKGEFLLAKQEGLLWKGMFSLTARYILFQGWRVFISMLSASIHSRHLMVWKIFAPKFIFESMAFLVTIPFILMSYLLVERISTSIKSLIEVLKS
ncbi:hypothetical protein AAG570_008080 [Ranatra chinensis]|uniref:GPI ethanolamine phosphate transferase 3 n=1 Tax=Ranatra chinensis TaxID=642074 RepID=A0ABD0XTP9_9HEMI